MKLFKRTPQKVVEVIPPPVEPEIVLSVSELLPKIQDGTIKNIVCLVGAGISVSCGIPDFRSKGTGLYDNLEQYKLPYAEAIFDLAYFKKTNGQAFYALAKEIWPTNFAPSPAHAFMRLLHDKGLLTRVFTQNIDTLERQAGIPVEKIIESHGSFGTASCVACHASFDQAECEEKIRAGDVPLRCSKCKGLVKPDIVFFGEDLPEKFFKNRKADMKKADLVIIMGTSLNVQPFAGVIDYAAKDTPRLLINLEVVGVNLNSKVGLKLRTEDNERDYMLEGFCDDGVRALCDALGWRDDLETLVEKFKSKSKATREPIDLQLCFPKMKKGLDYNWKSGKGTKQKLKQREQRKMAELNKEMRKMKV